MPASQLGQGTGFLAVFGLLVGLATTIFRLVVGWRAMIAHEKIAASLKELAEKRSEGQQPVPG